MKNDNLSIIEKKIQKDYGDIFSSTKELEESAGQVIPLTLGLDIGLYGGIKEGTVVTLAGNPGSGKTTLALTFLGNAQRAGKKVYYFDIENKLQPELVNTIRGLDVGKLKIVSSTSEKFLTAEDCFNIITDLLTEENTVIVLDSVASLCPDNLHSSQQGESKKMMTVASLMYDFMRKVSQILRPKKSILIMITHTQANPSPYGGPTEMGGNAMKFQASTRISCLSSKEVPDTGTKKTGRVSRFKIYKTALGPGTGEASFPIRYNYGYDYESDLVNLAEEVALVERSGAWYSYTNSKKELVKKQGAEQLVEYFRTNTEEAKFLDNKIRELCQKV